MPTTTGYEFGDVVLVPFLFANQTTKKRPAATPHARRVTAVRPARGVPAGDASR